MAPRRDSIRPNDVDCVALQQHALPALERRRRDLSALPALIAAFLLVTLAEMAFAGGGRGSGAGGGPGGADTSSGKSRMIPAVP